MRLGFTGFLNSTQKKGRAARPNLIPTVIQIWWNYSRRPGGDAPECSRRPGKFPKFPEIPQLPRSSRKFPNFPDVLHFPRRSRKFANFPEVPQLPRSPRAAQDFKWGPRVHLRAGIRPNSKDARQLDFAGARSCHGRPGARRHEIYAASRWKSGFLH